MTPTGVRREEIGYEDALREENRRIRALRMAVDMTLATIWQDPDLTVAEALELSRGLRRLALRLFPGKELAYALIYRPRLRRAIEIRFGVALIGRADIEEPGGG